MSNLSESDRTDIEKGAELIDDLIQGKSVDPDLVRYLGMLLLALADKLEQ